MAGGWALQRVRGRAKAGEETVPGLCRTAEQAESQESGAGLVSLRTIPGPWPEKLPRVFDATAGRTAAAAANGPGFVWLHGNRRAQIRSKKRVLSL